MTQMVPVDSAVNQLCLGTANVYRGMERNRTRMNKHSVCNNVYINSLIISMSAEFYCLLSDITGNEMYIN